MSSLQRGYLISFEGIDGSGKTSLATAIAQQLSLHIPVILTKQPGGTSFGKVARQALQEQASPLTPLAEFLLFAADRAQHIEEVIKPALAQGVVVLCDRMADSSIAYQGYGLGLDSAMLTTINEWAMAGIEPDVTLYIHVDAATAHQRCLDRGQRLTTFEKRGNDFIERVIQGYQKLAQKHTRIKQLDGTQPQEILLQQALVLIHQVLSSQAF